MMIIVANNVKIITLNFNINVSYISWVYFAEVF